AGCDRASPTLGPPQPVYNRRGVRRRRWHPAATDAVHGRPGVTESAGRAPPESCDHPPAMTSVPYLRPLLERNRPIWAMGAHDVTSAKIVERAGFDAIGVQSLQLAMVNGVPDIGIIDPDELVRVCRKIRRAVSLPIVVDFEQGFGEPYAAVYWMKE